MRSFVRKVLAIAVKDVLVELRSKERLYSMMMFSVLVMVIFNFAFDPGFEYVKDVAPGMLWVALTFSSILGLNKTFAAEKDQDCLQGLMLAPMDRSGIYLGKVIGNIVFSLVIALLSLPIFSIFFNIPVLHILPELVLVILLATVGFISVGTLFAAISVGVKRGEMLLPLLVFPVEVPVIIAAVKTSGYLFDGKGFDTYGNWIQLLVGFDVIYLAVSFAIFEHLVEE